MAEIRALEKNKKTDNTKLAIAKARQLIFEGSSCGKQLLSALVESKVIEERELQIALKKQLQEKEIELEKEINCEVLYFCKLDQNEIEKSRKKKNVMFADDNKNMYETRQAKMKQDKDIQACLEREDAAHMKMFLNSEKQEEQRIKKRQADESKEYAKQQQQLRKAKMKSEIESDKKIEEVKKKDDCRLMKIKQLEQQYNKVNIDTEAARINYQLLDKIEKEKRKRFEAFVDSGVIRHEEEVIKKEQAENMQRNRDKEEIKSMFKQQLTAIEQSKLSRRDQITCDRQCAFPKSGSGRYKNLKSYIASLHPPDAKCDKKLQFLSPPTKLIEELRLREQEPSPWTGVKERDALFVQEAERTLADCKHKAMARKVVDSYRRLNGLDSTTLPVKYY